MDSAPYKERSPGTSCVVKAHNIAFSYGVGTLQRPVLRDVNLCLMPGEVVIMSGPSGSGKTTFLMLVGALRTVQKGSLSVLGMDLKGASPKLLASIRRKIGYVFQHHNLIPALTALQNVCLGLEHSSSVTEKERLERAADVLKSVGLGSFLEKRPDELSGGQKQRIAVARALVSSPKLILADEPTAALDKETGHACVTLLRDLAKKNQSGVLLVTHDSRILDVADRVLAFEDGVLLDSPSYFS